MFLLWRLRRALCSVWTVEAPYIYGSAALGLGTQNSLNFGFLLCKMLGGVENLPHKVIVAAKLHTVSAGALWTENCHLVPVGDIVILRKVQPLGEKETLIFFPHWENRLLYVGWELALDASLPSALGLHMKALGMHGREAGIKGWASCAALPVM